MVGRDLRNYYLLFNHNPRRCGFLAAYKEITNFDYS